jgi:hypothetical protein
VFNVLFVGYSLTKNNINNTYQCNMISKKISKTMNYLIILIKFKVSRFLCRSVEYFIKCTPMQFPCFKGYFLEVTSQWFSTAR